MRRIWSEENKRRVWRGIWVSLARVESRRGLVSAKQVEELVENACRINMERSFEIEAEIRHDLMAELKAFAEQCPTAGGVIHLGATSMDIEDNADVIRTKAALLIVRTKLGALLRALSEKIERFAKTPVMAFTHLQPAEPTTLGYRFAVWAQDLLTDYRNISRLIFELKGKGFKGAVGTSASYVELVGREDLRKFETELSTELGIEFFTVTTQTCTRSQDYHVVSCLASIAANLHKMAFDLRILQSPVIGELSEPFAEKQVGSSAMPFKRNPIDAEKIDSLARELSVLPIVAWGNTSLSLLERTLDDSANRRTIVPEAFLISDEILKTALKIVQGLVVNEAMIERTLENFAPFACTERVLMAMAKSGADRQLTHECIRVHALAAWDAVKSGGKNPLIESILGDEYFSHILGKETLESLVSVKDYVGDSPERALELVEAIKTIVTED
jgi:adenylosuccinate lyase